MTDLPTTETGTGAERSANTRAPADHLRTTDDIVKGLEELRGLAIELHQRHYSHVPQWRALTSIRGLVQQIDNMTAGMAERIEKLNAAISWVSPRFVDENTSHEELKKRVAFLVADAAKANPETVDAQP